MGWTRTAYSARQRRKGASTAWIALPPSAYAINRLKSRETGAIIQAIGGICWAAALIGVGGAGTGLHPRTTRRSKRLVAKRVGRTSGAILNPSNAGKCTSITWFTQPATQGKRVRPGLESRVAGTIQTIHKGGIEWTDALAGIFSTRP